MTIYGHFSIQCIHFKLDTSLVSIFKLCCVQNQAIMNCVTKSYLYIYFSDGCSAAKSPFTVSAVGIAVPAKIEHPGNGQFSCNGQTNNTTNKQTYKSSLAQMETDSMMDLSKIKVDEIDEKSPEEDYAPKAKFLKLNDTITKCKKYVRLHTAEQEGRTSLASSNNSELNETFTLDGTFTMDPSSSCVPRFVVPCVDSLQSSKVSVCKSEVIESCPECKCRKSQVVNKTASSKNSCLNPFEIKRKTPCDTCKCAIEPHSEIESTSPSHFPDPNDDSGASTLVNSQATVSTLSDSQNLSSLSDITDVDYTKCPKTRGFRNSNKCSQSENLSDTFTKLNFSLPLTDKAGDNNAAVNTGMKVHAARSIKFDEGDNSKSSSNGKQILKFLIRHLTLVLLNKDATPISNFQPIKLLDPDC